MVLIGLVIVFAGLTYVAASGANVSAPIATFDNMLAASSSPVIIINGTITNGTASCASSVQSIVASLNKTPTLVYITNSTCKVGTTIKNASSCLNSYASKNIPVIIFTNSSKSSIRVYSLYGTMLSLSGNSSFMSRCPAALLLK